MNAGGISDADIEGAIDVSLGRLDDVIGDVPTFGPQDACAALLPGIGRGCRLMQQRVTAMMVGEQ
jgi:hypothetical protein